MNEQEKENFRWQASLAIYTSGRIMGISSTVERASELIAELEKTAPVYPVFISKPPKNCVVLE